MKNIIRDFALRFLMTTLILTGVFCFPSFAAGINSQASIAAFIEDMTINHGFDRVKLSKLLNQAKVKNSILKLIRSPSEAKPWHQYRKIFLTNRRIQRGLGFWQKNQSVLNTMANQYGVPPEIIVAIIGVETQYGEYTGSHQVLDALFTLAFQYPKRGQFFRKELENFLLLCREENIDPVIPTGSYAGAMGLPQFMPSSFRVYAADSNKDDRKDIWQNHGDSIASVANYFSKHGWQTDKPVTFRAEITGSKHETALGKGLLPSHTAENLRDLGVRFSEEIAPDEMVRLLKFKERDGSSYWVAMKNFYVITRYNHSAHYAMVVYQLSQAILAEQNRAKKPA